MNFLEAWLGISLDGGNGLLEAFCTLALLLAPVVAYRRRLFGKHRGFHRFP
jgi:hypothetical protein